jgi:hypothetical protein
MPKSDPELVVTLTRRVVLFFLLAAVSGCGVETATTTATGASIKAKEAEAAKKTQERAQQKLEQAIQQAGQRREEK